MPTTRTRGKSATQSPKQQQTNGPINGYPHQSSLLKIESVVPAALSKKPNNKSMHRSYSTLSSNYFKKTGTEQRHKSIVNGSKSPNDVQNGFWRIHRSVREKEKLPDRINLDRRGLTALPIIDDEPNLRLLSLQHNLINSFCVPANQKPSLVEDPSANQTTSTDIINTTNNNNSNNKKVDHLKPLSAAQSVALSANAPTNITNTTATKRPLITQKSMSTRNFNLKYGPPNSPLGLIPTTQNMMKNSFVQKSVLLHAKEKYVFKRANSFINNYSHQLPSTQAQRNHNLLHQNRLSTMSSFSNDSITPDPPTQDTGNKNAVDNLIVKNESFLEYIDSLQNLVFLDLYDNQIEKISALDGLKSLTVLLLGKNRIIDISGIISVRKTLRVLDLHGNRITNIAQKICQLQELKSLNLAGNGLKSIHADDFKGLQYLRELNLKRNKIKKLNGFDDLRSLERLWLCHNDLQKIEDLSCIAKSINLKEVTIENNPVSLGGDCVSFLVSYLPNLALLSQMQVTDQVRRAAMAWRKNKEISDANYSHISSDVSHSMRREEVISNARTNWELLRSQQQINKSSSFIQKSIRNTSQQLQVPVAEIEVDIYGNVDRTANRQVNPQVAIDRKLLRQKTIASRLDNRLRKNGRGRRSVSQESIQPETVVEEEIELPPSDFFRLPPILAPFIDQPTTTAQRENSSGSSLGPNIDSSSSCLSSDNEDGHREKEPLPIDPDMQQPTLDNSTPKAIDDNNPVKIIDQVSNSNNTPEKTEIEKPQTPISPVTIESKLENQSKSDIPTTFLAAATTVSIVNNNCTAIINMPPDEDTQSDKTSNISASSGKTIESTITNCSDESKSAKCRSANPNRKMTSPLVRSYTAKNQYSSVNQPTTIATSVLYHSNNPNQKASAKATTIVNDREREQGGDYLIEICGRYLNVYGAGAIKFVDRQWNTQKANDVHTLKFSYVNFNTIATILSKIKARFPNAENFIFRETNINSIGQLNALAEIQGIQSLTIDDEGNQVSTKNWRPYAIYRLSHWGIKTINGIDVTEDEIDESHRAYAGLSDLVLWSLPETLLEPLLTRLRLDETCSASKMTAKQWLMQADSSLKIVVGKEALQSKKPPAIAYQDDNVTRQRGRNYFSIMMENTCNAVEKLHQLETLWPNLLVEMIRNTLLDYSQIDVYVKNLMAEMQQRPS